MAEQVVYGFDEEGYNKLKVVVADVLRNMGGNLGTSGQITPSRANTRYARLVEPNCVVTRTFEVDGESKARIRLLEFDPEDPKNPTNYSPEGQYLDAWCQFMTGAFVTGDVFPVIYLGDRWWIFGGHEYLSELTITSVEPTGPSYECTVPWRHSVDAMEEDEIAAAPELKISAESDSEVDPEVGDAVTAHWDNNRKAWVLAVTYVNDSGGSSGGDCNCCDTSDCVDSGSITDCESGQAGQYYFIALNTLPSPFFTNTTEGNNLVHQSDCIWEGEPFDSNPTWGGTYKWVLNAAGNNPTITLTHVSGNDFMPPIVYMSSKPFSGLCGNQFDLWKAPGPQWVTDHDGWNIDGGIDEWNFNLAKKICLSYPYDECFEEPVPQKLKVKLSITDADYPLLAERRVVVLDEFGDPVPSPLGGWLMECDWVKLAGDLDGMEIILDFVGNVGADSCLWESNFLFHTSITGNPPNSQPGDPWYAQVRSVAPNNGFRFDVWLEATGIPGSSALHELVQVFPKKTDFSRDYWGTYTFDIILQNGCGNPYGGSSPVIGTATVSPA